MTSRHSEPSSPPPVPRHSYPPTLFMHSVFSPQTCKFVEHSSISSQISLINSKPWPQTQKKFPGTLWHCWFSPEQTPGSKHSFMSTQFLLSSSALFWDKKMINFSKYLNLEWSYFYTVYYLFSFVLWLSDSTPNASVRSGIWSITCWSLDNIAVVKVGIKITAT